MILTPEYVLKLKKINARLRYSHKLMRDDGGEGLVTGALVDRMRELLGFHAPTNDIQFLSNGTFDVCEIIARWQPSSLMVELSGGMLDGINMRLPEDAEVHEVEVLAPIDWEAKYPVLNVAPAKYSLVGFNTETSRRVFELVKS